MEFYIDCNYITEDEILNGIYERASKKYFDKVNDIICITELAEYIKKQLIWKKQDVYTNALQLLKAVCMRIAENFEGYCDYVCPDAKCPRDLFFAIFD